MKLSPRHHGRVKAKIAIQEAVVEAVKANELTYAELVGILAAIIESWTVSELRTEREESLTPVNEGPCICATPIFERDGLLHYCKHCGGGTLGRTS